MLDAKELERRWIKYKIKRYLPYLVGGIAALFAIAAASSWLTDAPETAAPVVKQPLPAQVSSPSRPAAAINETTVLEPSMNFVESFQSPAVQPQSLPVSGAVSKPAPRSVAISAPQTKVLEMPNYQPPVISAQPAPSPAGSERVLTINRNESKLDIEELQNRFKETSNANLGLFIAKYYYDRGNYNEAYNYALKTNAINSRIDESWILFSKSLVKLGRTEQAKKTLQLYYQQSNSEGAKELLSSIEKGTFK